MQTKHALASKTILGVIIAILPIVNLVFKVDITADEVTLIFGNIDAMISLGTVTVGLIMAIWGRFTAKKKLTIT